MIDKAKNTTTPPKTQHAVQLIGPDELILNQSKQVFTPGPRQILCSVEAVGLCFSDLKLLKQFSSHVRKGPVLSGIDPQLLKEVPGYAPATAPTVPGHEATLRVEAVGPDVSNFRPGSRYLIEPDFRWLRTAESNVSFGYAFEGALQEYVLLDERVITSPEGNSMMIPVSEKLSASAIALVEPWGCVEHAYSVLERRKIKPDGHMLVVADTEIKQNSLANLFAQFGRPARITWISKSAPPPGLNVPLTPAKNISKLPQAGFDDVIYFGCDANTAEALFAKIAPHGLYNIVLCGGQFTAEILTTVGLIHYSGIRIVGTAGCEPAASMKNIPETGQIRAGDTINVIGAAGPMGAMHVIRNICCGIKGIRVFAGDVNNNRLAALSKIAAPLAEKNGLDYIPYNPIKDKTPDAFDYTVLMAPIPGLAAAAVKNSAEGGIINIFAGIPSTVTARLDLNTYIKNRLYFIGTSGSEIEDMQNVLARAEKGNLDPNVSVAAICGLDGAIDGIRAVENRTIAGKVIVYPTCKGLKLTELTKLKKILPQVAMHLKDGIWNKKAEQALLEVYKKNHG